MNATAESKSIEILSPTQLKDAGKKLHNTPAYALDPKKAIMDFVEPFLPGVKVGPAKILVATFRQPERTAGGLIKTQRFLEEDKFQGIAGLVLKVGTLSFSDDYKFKFGGFKADVGEWVVYDPTDARATELRGLHCRIIDDSDIDATIDDPELFW